MPRTPGTRISCLAVRCWPMPRRRFWACSASTFPARRPSAGGRIEGLFEFHPLVAVVFDRDARARACCLGDVMLAFLRDHVHAPDHLVPLVIDAGHVEVGQRIDRI